MKIHPDVTLERVFEAVERYHETTDDPGFCTACGAEADGCEPYMVGGECETCGESAVYGAEELLLMMVS